MLVQGLQTRVLAWLDNIDVPDLSARRIGAVCDSDNGSHGSPPRQRSRKRSRLESRDTTPSKLNEHHHPLLPSPPGTHQGDKRCREMTSAATGPETPKKRKLHQEGNLSSAAAPGASDGDDDFENDATITPRPLHQDISSRPISSIARSDSATSTSGVSSRSGRSSPSKQFTRLGLLENGVEQRPMSLNNTDMPTDLKTMIRAMDLIGYAVGVVPLRLRGDIEKEGETDESLSGFLPFSFASEDADDWTPPTASAGDYDLRSVLAVVRDAEYCVTHEQDEAGWNCWVHGPLLRMAIHGGSGGDLAGRSETPSARRLVGFTNCTSASVARPYRVEKSPSNSKKVDFALYLEPDHDQDRSLETSPRDKTTEDHHNTHNTDTNAAAIAVDRICAQQPNSSINMTDFATLRKRPMTVSIETKRSDGDQMARLQIGTWQAAQWNMLQMLANDRQSSLGAPQPDDCLQGLTMIPGLIVVGHQWKFVATSRSGGKTLLWFERCIGYTNTVLGTFQVIAGIRKLAEWSQFTFWPWYKHAILGVPAAAPSSL